MQPHIPSPSAFGNAGERLLWWSHCSQLVEKTGISAKTTPSNSRKTIQKLETLDLDAPEFFTTTCKYYLDRFRSLSLCGVFFICMALVLCAASSILWGNQELFFFTLALGIFSMVVGVITFMVASSGTALLDAARLNDNTDKPPTLLLVATSLNDDPVSTFLLSRLEKDPTKSAPSSDISPTP